MTNAIKLRLAAIAAIIVASLALTSCDPEEPYRSPFTGTWETAYDILGDLYDSDPEYMQFAFSDYGFGTQYYYDDFGYWTSMDFDWHIRGNNLMLHYSNGTNAVFFFRPFLDYIEISTDPYFKTYYGLYQIGY